MFLPVGKRLTYKSCEYYRSRAPAYRLSGEGLRQITTSAHAKLPSTRPARVLIIESLRDVATFYASALSRGGFNTSAFRSAPPAMESLPTFRPDVAIVACGSGDIDGVAVVADLRAAFAFGSRPIAIIVSPGFHQGRLDGLVYQAVASSPVGLVRLWELLANCGVKPLIEE